jgi:MFS transporter, YQGE family, putative transporter
VKRNNITSTDLKRLLISHNLLVAGRVFFEIFINVFIWKQTENLNLIAWFNIAYLLMHTVSFHAFAGFVKKGKVHLPRQAGLIGFAIVYFIIYLLKEEAIKYIIPIAILIGICNGMYWISYQILRFDLTNTKNRGNYTGLENGTKIFVNIIMPSLGGAIVVANWYNWGYSSLFLLGAILFLCSFIIGNVNFKVNNTPHFHIRKTFAIIIKDKDIMKSMWGHACSSFSRGGTIARLLIPLLIYDVLKNELHMGGWLSVFSVIAIISSISFGKLIDYKHYKFLLIIGGLSYFLLIMSVITFPTFLTYILFGALIKIVDIFIRVPKRVISENLILSLKKFKNHRIEYIVIREWFNIGIGRIMSFVVLLTATNLVMEQMRTAIAIMAFAVLVEIILLTSIKKEVLN